MSVQSQHHLIRGLAPWAVGEAGDYGSGGFVS